MVRFSTRMQRDKMPLLLQEEQQQSPSPPLRRAAPETTKMPKKKKSWLPSRLLKGKSARNDANNDNSSEAVVVAPEEPGTASLQPQQADLNAATPKMTNRAPSRKPKLQVQTNATKPNKRGTKKFSDLGLELPPTPGSKEDSKDEAPLVDWRKPTTHDARQKMPSSSSPMATPVAATTAISPTTKAILSRPFGRQALADTTRRTWIVEVSPAEWDAEEHCWKYRILVQQQQQPESPALSQPSFAFTYRSLADFCWLEEHLRMEFGGGLLLPLLSVAIGTPDLANTQHEVDAELLRDWLSDVLNGIRGQGELRLKESVNIIASETMEAFLFRNTDPLSTRHRDNPRASLLSSGSTVMPWQDPLITPAHNEESFVEAMFQSFPLGDFLCMGPPSANTSSKRIRPLDRISCTSRALGSAATLDVQDSFAETLHLAQHFARIEAEKDLILSYRRTALTAMEKLRFLVEEETQIGAAWKRLAIALSNLFAYEKDVENARVGDSGRKREIIMPYRKLRKSTVDDCLRVLARQKVERSLPALHTMNTMLSAYVADLSAVEPSFLAYTGALQRLKRVQETDTAPSTPEHDEDQTGWQDQIKIFFKRVSTGDSAATESSSSSDQSRKHRFEKLFWTNEELLQESLTTLCKATNVRTTRMAWKFFNMEVGQIALLNSSAYSLRTKLSLPKKNDLATMIKRHHEGEKEDLELEIALVDRLVQLGKHSKYTQDQFVPDDEKAQTQLLMREQALQMAKERAGRWNAKLALAMMEAVGVENADVRVEETTRELRLVRKYAIGLRDNLNRCIEAVDILRSSILEGQHDTASIREYKSQDESENHFMPIRDKRRDFCVEISKLFSGMYIPPESRASLKPPSQGALLDAGVDTSDALGWRSAYERLPEGKTKQNNCGEIVMSYVDSRDKETEWLLRSLSDLLDDYNERIEGIEGFVYMECVGLQLEKHFSQRRAIALSDFEKKTDITTAINIATRKRLPRLVSELQAKMEAIGTDVSHTSVKEAKEAHLESKSIKAELHSLALRRLQRARESSTERVISLMTVWAKAEETAAATELKWLKRLMEMLESSVGDEDPTGFISMVSEVYPEC